MLEKLSNWASDAGISAIDRLLPCLLILMFGSFVVKLIVSMIDSAMAKSKLEKAAHSLIHSVVKTILYGILLLVAASTLGIDVTGIVALASVVTLAISLALQNSLTNLIGGFTLLYTKPFHSGDYVEVAGQSGTVKEIGMAYTQLITPDNKLVQIPNATVVSNDIVNYTVTGKRRVDVVVSASYSATADQVFAAMKEAANVEGILDDPAIFTAITSYGQYEINYVVRVWCPTDKYWDVNNAILYNITKVFAREGIAMRDPHVNVHMDK